MFDRVRAMLVKEFIQALRDPRMARFVFIVPVIQLVVFGYAARTDVTRIRLGLYDLDRSVVSRDLVSRFTASGCFRVVANVESDTQARELLDRGQVQVVLRLNRGFGDRVHAGATAPVQVLVDGTDSNTAGIALSYCQRLAQEASEAVLVRRFERAAGPAPRPAGVALQARAWFNEELESCWFYVPGLIATIPMLLSLILTSMAVVREREVGTMEQVLVTPISSMEFILGKTAPFALIGLVDVVLVMVAGTVWFGVPLRGSIPLLFLCTGLFLLSTLGAGLLISTVCRTQQQAMMSTFMFFFPAMMLSGFIFPIANMPRLVQALTYLNPLRYFLVILRGLFLKGVGVAVLWPQMLALAGLGTVTFTLACWRFRKTVA